MNKKIKILLVDDSPTLLKLYSHLLTSHDPDRYTIFEAGNCADGIALYHREKPDCVVLDFVLPDGNGLGVIEQLSQGGEPLPIVLATSYGSEQLAVDAIKAGAQHYLLKDKITQESLVVAINNTIERVAMFREIKIKNTEIKSYIHIISHDLREPINSCTSLLEMILDEPAIQSDENLKFLAKKTLNCISHAQDMIRDLLSYATLGTQAEDFTTVNCDTLVKEVEASLEAFIKNESAEITVSALPEVVGIKSLIKLLLQNLIQNGIKYNTKETKQVHIGCLEMSNEWIFSVQDNGRGIPEEAFDQIFGMFSRTNIDGNIPGTGLGLSACQKAASMMGGRIWVESEVGTGSTFFFSLPKTPASAASQAA